MRGVKSEPDLAEEAEAASKLPNTCNAEVAAERSITQSASWRFVRLARTIALPVESIAEMCTMPVLMSDVHDLKGCTTMQSLEDAVSGIETQKALQSQFLKSLRTASKDLVP